MPTARQRRVAYEAGSRYVETCIAGEKPTWGEHIAQNALLTALDDPEFELKVGARIWNRQ